MKTADFDFSFPENLIAHAPVKRRDCSHLMVLDRTKQTIQHKHFYDIVDFLHPGDLLVLNDTKVIPARLFGRKVRGGARVEVFLESREQSVGRRTWETWKCLVKPGKRLRVGSEIVFGQGQLLGRVVEKLKGGEQIIEFKAKKGKVCEMIHKLGEIPLPPYIRKIAEKSSSRAADSRAKRYQTVYAAKEGASAAPTAGLHFTKALLAKLKKKGVKIAYITLHTGLGTFLPVRSEELKDHQMHAEYFEVPAKVCEMIHKAKRVIAVGTTVVRALETVGNENSIFDIRKFDIRRATNFRISNFESRISSPIPGSTILFIYPGFKFKVVDAMITNFHWPRSTLIMLVSAFAGKDFVMRAYQEAIKQKYLFFSFGDAMLIV